MLTKSPSVLLPSPSDSQLCRGAIRTRGQFSSRCQRSRARRFRPRLSHASIHDHARGIQSSQLCSIYMMWIACPVRIPISRDGCTGRNRCVLCFLYRPGDSVSVHIWSLQRQGKKLPRALVVAGAHQIIGLVSTPPSC